MNKPVIIAETDQFWVVNKPAGYSCETHHRFPSIAVWIEDPNSERIVHRLDVETSGVMLWAKSKAAQEELKLLWQGRQTKKTYLALVAGETPESGVIDLAITRDNKKDKQKVVMLRDGSGRPAITNYQRLKIGEIAGQKVSLIEAHPVTGRTHQIRVHCKAIGHPLVGDKLYGEKASDQVAKLLDLDRHFLHASVLCLPINEVRECFQADLPDELTHGLDKVGLTI